MTGKSQALYEELFCSLNTKCAQLGFHLDPSVVVSDFELAVIGAFVRWSTSTAVAFCPVALCPGFP